MAVFVCGLRRAVRFDDVMVMGLKIFLACLLLVLCSVASADSATPLFLKRCSAQSSAGVKLEDLQRWLAESSLSDLQVRQKWLNLMAAESNPCRKALEIWLTQMRTQAVDHKTNTGRIAAVTLGVLLNLPMARDFIEVEASSESGLEWLATLQQWDEQAFNQLLQSWVLRRGLEVRRRRGLSNTNASLYGKVLIENSAVTNSSALFEVSSLASPVVQGASAPSGPSFAQLPPLVLDLFLKSVIKREISREELFSLNSIFVDLKPGVRKIYADQFAALIRRHSVLWIETFRNETAWTQFQLLEPMGRARGAEIVRELMWLGQNHSDTRMRLRASQVLDEAISNKSGSEQSTQLKAH
jgi:hypothetical protein